MANFPFGCIYSPIFSISYVKCSAIKLVKTVFVHVTLEEIANSTHRGSFISISTLMTDFPKAVPVKFY